MFTIDECAERAGCHRDTISRAIKAGKLPHIIVTGRFQKKEYRIKEEDLLEWMKPANRNVVMPVEQYAEMSASLQATTALVVKVVDALSTMQATQNSIMQQLEQQEARQDSRDKVLMEFISEWRESKKKRPWWAKLFKST